MKALCTAVFSFFLSLTVCCQSLQDKASPLLFTRLRTAKPGDEIKLLISVSDTALFKKMKDVVVLHRFNKTFVVAVKASALSLLLSNEKVLFASEARTPKEELTTGAFDLSLNKISLVHDKYATINGNGIAVSVKEQRFDTTDIDIKGRYLNTGTAASTQSDHASIMATIIGGGANSSPFAKGVAWGSNLSTSDFATLLPDANGVYLNNGIRIQNHSYGTGIENFYGADAVAYDAAVYSLPTLVHVFSAGNSGTSSSTSGTYAGITGFANLTGSFKMAKNVITVGHVDSTNAVLPLSSKGPAYDGRIKPELVAFGEDGSSGAAALVSGTVALLQQAYKQSHNGSYPSAALVKAILLNSADDIGTKGPDYVSGYGSLNAYNAMQSVNGNAFFEDALTNGATKTFSVTVPSHAKQLKITLAWTDTAAQANAAKALVNDIDALLVSPSSQNFQPWMLNAKAAKDSLLLPAVRGVDTLNNVEQITVEAPQAGTYQLFIKGSKIATASQPFAVSYQIDTLNGLVWTFPSSSSIIKAGQRNYLRWQTAITGNGTIEYATNGSNWQTLSSSVDVAKNYFVWTAPDTLTTALLRMKTSSPSLIFVSDTFAVSPSLQLQTAFNCADSFALYWNKLSTLSYQLYQLGTQYLQPLLSTNDTFRVFQKSIYPSLYYGVAPRIGNKLGQRSFTINYTSQGVGCYVVSFYSVLKNGNAALLSLNLGTLYNVAQVSFQKLTGGGFQTIGSFSPTSLTQSFVDAALMQGINRYRIQIKLANGAVLYSDEDEVYYFPNRPVIVYPNPASQNSLLNIAVKDQGVYSIKLYDVAGRLLKTFELNNVVNPLPSFTLPKGLYFVQVVTGNSNLFVQKLVVY